MKELNLNELNRHAKAIYDALLDARGGKSVDEFMFFNAYELRLNNFAPGHKINYLNRGSFTVDGKRYRIEIKGDKISIK